MVELGEWHVVVRVTKDLDDGRAEMLAASIQGSLSRWAGAAEKRFSERDAGVSISVGMT